MNSCGLTDLPTFICGREHKHKNKTFSNDLGFLQITLYHICFVLESMAEPIFPVLKKCLYPHIVVQIK